MRPAAWPGFNHLGAGTPTPALRSSLLGVLLGVLLGMGWLQSEGEALAVLQGQQQVLQAELQQLDAELGQAQERARRAQARQQEWARLQSWQATRWQVLDSLEALAQSSEVRLSLLRFEDQVLSVQGQAQATRLQPWVDGVNAQLSGWGAGELLELSAQAASSAEPQRFSLRWSVPASPLAP